jgi:NifB/MoaA-like Fe-S oxidoreductase
MPNQITPSRKPTLTEPHAIRIEASIRDFLAANQRAVDQLPGTIAKPAATQSVDFSV